MEIPGYKYIEHQMIPRPWGPQCRFLVVRPDGVGLNDEFPVDDLRGDDETVAKWIAGRLAVLDVVHEPEPPPPGIEREPLTDAVVERYLKDRTILTEKQTLADVVASMTAVAAKG